MADRDVSQNDLDPTAGLQNVLPPSHDYIWRTKNLNTEQLGATLDGSIELVSARAISKRTTLLQYNDSRGHRFRWVRHAVDRPEMLKIETEVLIKSKHESLFFVRDKFLLHFEYRSSRSRECRVNKYCIITGKKMGNPIQYGWMVCQTRSFNQGILMITYDPSVPLFYALEEVDNYGKPKGCTVFPPLVNRRAPIILRAEDQDVLLRINDWLVKYNIDSDIPEWSVMVGDDRIIYSSCDEDNYLTIFQENKLETYMPGAPEGIEVSVFIRAKATGHLVASTLLLVVDSVRAPFVYYNHTLFYFGPNGYRFWDRRLVEIATFPHENGFKLSILETRTIIQGRFICLLGSFACTMRSAIYIFDLQDMSVVNSIWLPRTRLPRREEFCGEEFLVSENGLFHRYGKNSGYKFYDMTSMIGNDMNVPKPHLANVISIAELDIFLSKDLFPTPNGYTRCQNRHYGVTSPLSIEMCPCEIFADSDMDLQMLEEGMQNLEHQIEQEILDSTDEEGEPDDEQSEGGHVRAQSGDYSDENQPPSRPEDQSEEDQSDDESSKEDQIAEEPPHENPALPEAQDNEMPIADHLVQPHELQLNLLHNMQNELLDEGMDDQDVLFAHMAYQAPPNEDMLPQQPNDYNPQEHVSHPAIPVENPPIQAPLDDDITMQHEDQPHGNLPLQDLHVQGASQASALNFDPPEMGGAEGGAFRLDVVSSESEWSFGTRSCSSSTTRSQDHEDPQPGPSSMSVFGFRGHCPQYSAGEMGLIPSSDEELPDSSDDE